MPATPTTRAAAEELIAETDGRGAPLLPVLIYREDLAQARHDILCWLAGGAQHACAVLVKSVEREALGLKQKRKRRSFPSTASADARYIIDILMDKTPAVRDANGGGVSLMDCPPDELAKRRDELVRATRELRKDENK